MNERFSAFVRVLTAVLWGPHVLLLILLAGVWFTLHGRFMQVTKLPGMTRGALCGTQRCGGFSAFQSLTASLAGSLGTGNILGVAAAILLKIYRQSRPMNIYFLKFFVSSLTNAC